eukprot:6640531-Prymnesium_polylepis.2
MDATAGSSSRPWQVRIACCASLPVRTTSIVTPIAYASHVALKTPVCIWWCAAPGELCCLCTARPTSASRAFPWSSSRICGRAGA